MEKESAQSDLLLVRERSQIPSENTIFKYLRLFKVPFSEQPCALLVSKTLEKVSRLEECRQGRFGGCACGRPGGDGEGRESAAGFVSGFQPDTAARFSSERASRSTPTSLSHTNIFPSPVFEFCDHFLSPENLKSLG